jgi:HD-GYP domain-containing protein (c-di-GMP phosphodiesterase class II)
VERFADVPPIVYDVIQNHHERADGSGYPKGKTAQQLSDYAQMAAIVDSYDAMITNRVYKCSDNATDALKKLQSDPSMNTQLVREFINAIGLHPVGSLVKLSNDRLALVSKRNVNDPLKPVVMSFYHIQGHVHTDIERVDLAQTDTEIVSGIRPEEFSISLSSFFKKAFLPVG